MAAPFIQPAFSVGEIAPSLYGRVDVGKEHIAATTLRNAFVGYRGGANSRAGTAFVGFSKQTGRSYPPRMVPFQFSINQGLALEFGNQYMRVVSSGAFVTENPITITGATQANPCVVSATAHAVTAATPIVSGVTTTYAPGDTITLTGGTALSQAVLTVSTTQIVSIVLNAAGSSYAVNDTITLSGGTSSVAAVLTVLTESAGKIETFSVTTAGTFSANPNGGNMTQASTSGSGTGATFQAAVFGPKAVTVTSGGVYGVEPSNPVAQGSSSGIGTGATFTATWGSTAAFSNGDWVQISGVSGMTQLNGQTYVVASSGTSSFALQDVYGNNIDSSAFSSYVSGGTASRIYTLTTPWAEEDLPFLKFTQSADVMSICCWNQNTGTEYAPQDLARIADDNWAIGEPEFIPTVQPPGSCSLTASTTGSVYYSYGVTSINPLDGTESIMSPAGGIANAVDITATDGMITVAWSQVAGVSQYNIYKATPGYGAAPPAGSLYGYAGSAQGNQFVDRNIVADFTQVPPTAQNPFAPGQIVSAPIITAGTGFTQGVSVKITGDSGSGCVLLATVSGGVITGVTVVSGGSNYSGSGEVVFSGSGTGATATYSVTRTPYIGPVASVTVTDGGSGYAANPAAVINTSTGSGAVLLPVVTNGGVSALIVQEAGQDYAATDTVTITGSGTGATGGLVVGPTTGINPGVVSYFQQRRVYASTINNPDTYWMSQPGSFSNFDSRIPTIASDAITGTPWSVEVNGIQFMLPMPGGLVVLTGLQAWQLNGGGGAFGGSVQAITPSSQDAQPQAYNGCSNRVPPIRIDYDILYVQAKGSIVRDLSYNIYANIYTGNDITILNSQLFTGYQINEWAWCEEPYKIVWAVRNDGILLSLTYLKQQEVMGWARHDTHGRFQSVCSVTEPPVDALYCAVLRFPSTGAAYMVERMDNRLWATIEDCWCVDAALQLPQPQPNATLTASSSTGLGSITGGTVSSGGSGYSSGTTATVIDNNGQGPGTGAVPTLTISGGVITAVSFGAGNQGSGYVNPALSINDPAELAGGSGAVVALTLNNSATFSTDQAVFSSGSVGSVIRVGSGKAVITGYTDSQHVTANIIWPLVTAVCPNSGGYVQPQAPGNWTLTAPVTNISGLNHLIGSYVTGLADGLVIPTQQVSASGTITLGTAASAVTIGLGYQVQLQSVYLDAGQPTVQGQRKKIAAVSVRLEDTSIGVQVGANQPDGSALSPQQVSPAWSNLATLPTSAAPSYGSTVVPLWTGDVRAPIQGGFAKPGQVALQQSLPLPMSVLAIIPEVLGGDEPEAKAQPKQQRRAA